MCVLDSRFSLIINSIPKLIVEKGSLQRCATSICYIFVYLHSVFREAFFYSSQLCFWPFWSCPSSCQPVTWCCQHTRGALSGFYSKQELFCWILQGRPCNLKLSWRADHFTLLITRAKVERRQCQWVLTAQASTQSAHTKNVEMSLKESECFIRT